MESDLFYRYYDALFASKNYSFETDVIASIAQKYNIDPIGHLLEIGCGTGSHTVELSRKAKKMTAVDVDPAMIIQAEKRLEKQQIENAELFSGRVQDLKIDGFDLAVAMFNVVTYIDDMDELIGIFKSVKSKLKAGGIFVFDCWNGVAAIKDPPTSKETSVKIGDEKIHCLLTSETNLIDQRTTLTYTIEVKNSTTGRIEKGVKSFDQTLWTPNQIKYALNIAGMEVLHCSKNFDIDSPATEKDWKVMFVCRRN